MPAECKLGILLFGFDYTEQSGRETGVDQEPSGAVFNGRGRWKIWHRKARDWKCVWRAVVIRTGLRHYFTAVANCEATAALAPA